MTDVTDLTPTYHAAPLPRPSAEVERPHAPAFPATAAGGAARAATSPRSVLQTALGFYGIVIVFASGYAFFSGQIKTLFGESWPGLGHVLSAVAVGLGVVILTRLGDRLLSWVRRANDEFRELLGPFTPVQGIGLALLSGFAEELLFRGALWPHLGLIGTSLLFGLVHVVPRRALLLYPAFAAAVGFLFGLLRSGSGSVLPAMLAHALINGINLVWLAKARAANPAAASAAASAAATAPLE